MRNFLLLTLLGLILIVGLLYITNLFWYGSHENSIGSTIKLELNQSNLKISSSFGTKSSSQKVSYILSELNSDKNEIYVSVYSKYYSLSNPIYQLQNNLKLDKKGIYKVFYKNSDGGLYFIQDIEVR